MREIKFRAWDKKNKRMLLLELNGFLTDIEDARYTLLEVVFSSRHVAYVDDYYHNTNQEQFSLMQYTGLKDKNGKEIYEGDIIRYLYVEELIIQDSAQVEFKDGMFGIEGKDGYGQINWQPLEQHTRKGGLECEVIGNIYENPELLNNQSGVLDE